MSTPIENANAERPSFVKEKHLKYLDSLRESGITNMYGACPYLRNAFVMSADNATKTLLYWMRTFSERHAQPASVGAVDPHASRTGKPTPRAKK